MEPCAGAGVRFAQGEGEILLVPKSIEYLEYAAECVRLAAKTHNQSEKALLITVAERWRELADRVHKIEEQEEPRSPRKGHRARPH
jgi:hypothetical protein